MLKKVLLTYVGLKVGYFLLNLERKIVWTQKKAKYFSQQQLNYATSSKHLVSSQNGSNSSKTNKRKSTQKIYT